MSNAFDTLGFVQADPIRAPARSQDLVLRHRVARYRVGDLDRWYASTGLEEGVLYAYGFLRRSNWELLRTVNAARLSRLERDVLEFVRHRGPLSAKDLEAYLGRARAINDWGRQSSAVNVAMEQLRRRGLLRVAARDQGMRRYALAPPQPEAAFSPHERYRRLVLLVARVLAPIPEKTLSQVVARFRRIVHDVQNHKVIIDDLYRTGDLVKQPVEGLVYVWPAVEPPTQTPARRVRFLAPFDPLVWDRRKFEHLWGWTYRFEAYTPPSKRIRGYYAMPLLFGDRVIGWANVAVVEGRLVVELGFVNGRRPAGREFTTALEREIAELESFLAIDSEGDGRAADQPVNVRSTQ